ncbi:TetR/AcrR family transcriptional regulator C-terminal domain-containing protein [Actinomadura madurae]|nr:TetR/AcrR family transcriptional regulator C-terminal domain-containing protein [Actinomadura madurae]
MIHRHPWTVTLFGSRPMIGPNATRVLDEVLAAFGAAGFAGFDLEYAWSAVVDYVIGAAGQRGELAARPVRHVRRRMGREPRPLPERAGRRTSRARRPHPRDLDEGDRRRPGRPVRVRARVRPGRPGGTAPLMRPRRCPPPGRRAEGIGGGRHSPRDNGSAHHPRFGRVREGQKGSSAGGFGLVSVQPSERVAT